MAARQSLHVFQCDGGSPYAFTFDPTGANLPAAECQDSWQHLKTLESEPFDLPRVTVDVEKVHVEVAKQGYSIVSWTAGPG